MTPDSVLRLKKLLQREISSLLSYQAGAWPWSSTKERETSQKLQRLIEAEQAAQSRLGAVLRRTRVAPPTPSFSMDFTSMHFVALDYLLPLLVEEQKGLIGKIEADLAAMDDEAGPPVSAFLELKRQHLAELEQLAAEHSGAKALSTVR